MRYRTAINTLLVAFVVIILFPLKLAKNPQNYSTNSDEYILCMETRVTGYDWIKLNVKTDSIKSALDSLSYGTQGDGSIVLTT